MELHIQRYLRHPTGNPDQLEKDLGIYYNIHPKFPELYQFKYDQIYSPKFDLRVKECRGIILNRNDNWHVVARPFDRFFNYGEGEDPIDWKSAKFQTKVDGSLCILYNYKGEWHVATSGTADAGGNVFGFDFNFRELFWNTWNDHGYTFESLNSTVTYLFELTSPYNRVVVPYKEKQLTLLGARHAYTGAEFSVDDIPGPFNKVQHHALDSIDHVIKSFEHIDPLSQEGYVVVDGNFNRVKVKHPGYVALHNLKGEQLVPRRILELIRTGESGEFLTYFPEFATEFNKYSFAYNTIIENLENTWEACKDIENQKEFALAVGRTNCVLSGAVFNKRRYGGDFKAYVREMNIKHLEELANKMAGYWKK